MRHFLAPEVVQTSTLDCGPAALHSLLAGFKIPSNYGRLREACQTGLDGTSIDTLELVANSCGLGAEQLLLPADHAFLPEARALPAIVVVTLADGQSHFVVIWRRHGRYLQLMDPAVGRRWVKLDRFRRELYQHGMSVPAEAWREFAGSDEFCNALRARLKAAGLSARAATEAVRLAKIDETWASLGVLDAACRAVTAMGLRSQAGRILETLRRRPEAIPVQFWSARPEEGEEETLSVRGAILVRALKPASAQTESAAPPELTRSPESSAFTHVARFFRSHGLLTPSYLAIAAAATALGILVETLLFRGLFDFASQLQLPAQRLGAIAALALFSFVIFLLEMLTFTGTTRICRRLEASFRTAFFRKIPRLPDRYFQSRLQSDMGERSHALHRLRYLPDLVRRLVASLFELLATATGMVWLEPATAPFVAFAIAAALVPAWLGRAFLNEGDLRVKTHAAALTRYYLDAALGLSPVRVHGAENNIRRAHSVRLHEWKRAALRLQRSVVTVEALQTTAMFSAIALLFLTHPLHGSDVGRLLLVAYWALNLPTAGANIGVIARQLPGYRSLILRVTEPLQTEEEHTTSSDPTPSSNRELSILCRVGFSLRRASARLLRISPHPPATAKVVAQPDDASAKVVAQPDDASAKVVAQPDDASAAPSLTFSDVTAEASGHTLLAGITLEIPAGSHVAVIGPSGAGKSTLLGLLLGWLTPKEGQILVEGQPLQPAGLRRAAAWVDPAVQLWNRPLYDNLVFGSQSGAPHAGEAVDAAHLRTVLQDLPEGLQTVLGEGGGRLSGGEGQRVRLARAILKKDVPLVLLDEPFRGLDRPLRNQLLAEARTRWSKSTLLCVTHDLAETHAFDQVIVIENGQIAEAGAPSHLLANESSRYRQLIEAERDLQHGLWHRRHWRRLKVGNGRLIDSRSQAAPQSIDHAEEVA